MSLDQIFVGTLALTMAVVAGAAAAGPWQQPYQLRAVRQVRRRWGKTAARGLLLLVAAVMLAAGAGILCGVRPSYALPDDDDVSTSPAWP